MAPAPTPLTAPEEHRGDTWQEKIELAKEARRMGAALRRGRPVTFSRDMATFRLRRA